MRVNIIYNRRHTATPKGGNGQVEIEVSSQGRRRRIATGVNVPLANWKNGCVVGMLGCKSMNDRIRSMYDMVCELAYDEGFNAVTASKFRVEEKHEADDFIKWLKQRVHTRRGITETTRARHITVMNYIEENANKLRMRSLKGITALTIRKMDEDLMAKGLSRSSIYNYHKMLKYWLGVAVEEGFIAKSPYEGVKLDKGKRDDIKYLTDAEREKVEKFKCDGTIAKVRDMFLLACYTGLSYSDMSKIDPQDFTHEGERIKLRSHRVKTGGLYTLTILPKAKEILERYGWKVPNISNQKCNQYLKAIQSACGIRTTLTMHVGRHTFATWALQKGVQIEVVSKMLGHSSINTTQIYAKVLQQSVDAGFDTLM